MNTSTICAIATPSGGAIGIIRVSGPEAINLTSQLFVPAGKKSLKEKEGSSLTFGKIVDPANGDIVDEVLVSLFRAPHSYTGEDSTEISCHGSQYILSRVLQLLVNAGCQLAKPGEYTQRAFLNGKMDLSQAEAVADLIASSTAANHRMAMRQMRGGFSKELRELRDHLLHITSLLELELDFSDHEDLEFASRDELLSLAQQIHDRITRLCRSFKLGNALKRGIPVAIVGETNAGKSTLLNALVGEQRALVSNIHGTTRDTVEETVVVGGTLIRFIDTAGIRSTTDTVEQMGIERTYEKIEEADIVLWLIDATAARAQYDHLSGVLAHTDKHVVPILNKTDLLDHKELDTLHHELQSLLYPAKPAVANPTETISCPSETSPVKASSPALENTVSPRTAYSASDFSVPENSTSAAIVTCTSEDAVSTRDILCMSAHNSADIDRLRHILSAHLQMLSSDLTSDTDLIVSNTRHYEALSHALTAIDRVTEGLHSGLSGDFISQDLRECIYHLSDIAGEVTTDQVLGNIFKHFCVGK